MDDAERRIAEAIQLTRVVRPPKQHLATFGITTLQYYVVTEPSYSELVAGEDESVVRQGTVVSQRPGVVTPTYMLNLGGFSGDAERYMESLARRLGPNSPGLLYEYRNEPGGLEIVGGQVAAVGERIADDLDRRGKDLASVILGKDDLWDLSLLKFIYEYTAASLASNLSEMHSMGLFDPEPGGDVPRAVVQRIEELFQQVTQGLDPLALKQELDRWGLFDHYQDRFFSLVRRK